MRTAPFEGRAEMLFFRGKETRGERDSTRFLSTSLDPLETASLGFLYSTAFPVGIVTILKRTPRHLCSRRQGNSLFDLADRLSLWSLHRQWKRMELSESFETDADEMSRTVYTCTVNFSEFNHVSPFFRNLLLKLTPHADVVSL